MAIFIGCGATRKSSRRRTLDGRPVLAVKVLGNETLSSNEIISRLSLKPSGLLGQGRAEFQTTAARLDKKRIASLYKEHGFFRVRVSDPQAIRHRHGVAVLYRILEGQQTKIKSVELSALPPRLSREAKEVLEDLDVVTNAAFNYETYVIAKDELKTLLINSGYAHADTTGMVQVDRDRSTAQIEFRSAPGPSVQFGKTQILGLTEVPETAMKHRIAWQEGAPYDPQLLDKSSQYLRELGFASVKLSIDRVDRPQIADVSAQVNDGKPREVKLGLGGGKDANRWEVRVRGDYAQKRFLHPLNTLESHAQIGRIFVARSQFTYKALGSLSRQDFLAPLFSGTISGVVIDDDYQAFTAFDIGGGITLKRPFLERKIRAKIGWELHAINIRPDAGLAGNLSSFNRLGYFEQSVSFDFRDKPLNTSKGVYLGLSLEEAGPYSISEQSYIRGTADLRGYIPFGQRLVLAARIAGGAIVNASDSFAPLTRRFYGGGSSDHRGFSFRNLSPTATRQATDSNGNVFTEQLPIGGSTSFLATGEARIVLKQFSSNALVGALFLDAGDVTASKDALDFAQLHYAAGFGLRFQTPVGPIRLDFAYRLNRTAPTEPDGRVNPLPGNSFGNRFLFHATIGEPF